MRIVRYPLRNDHDGCRNVAAHNLRILRLRLREQDTLSTWLMHVAERGPQRLGSVSVVVALLAVLAVTGCGEYQNQGIDTLIDQQGPGSEQVREQAAIEAVQRATPGIDPKDTIAHRVDMLIARSQAVGREEHLVGWVAVPVSRRVYLVRLRLWQQEHAVDLEWRVDLLTGKVETSNDMAFWLTNGRVYR